MNDSSIFVDIVLWGMYIALALGIVAAVWSAIHGVRTHEASHHAMTSRHTGHLGYITAGFVGVVLLLTYLLASTQPVVSNGTPFTDTLWLRLTDMFIFSSIILICVCSVIVVVAKFRR